MLPKYHVLFGAIFSVLIWLLIPGITPISAAIIFLSSVVIDIDHYLIYAFSSKDWSLKNSYLLHKNISPGYKPMFHLLHTAEFILLIGILGIYTKIFMLIFIGLIFHSILDFGEMAYNNGLNQREYFLSRYIIKRKEGRYFDYTKKPNSEQKPA